MVPPSFDQLVEWNEDNNVASTTTDLEAPAALIARRLFYNDSFFDGNDPSANDADDYVVAPDKFGLRQGQQSSAANVGYFGRGINGIVVDVERLRAAPTFDVFLVSVGSSSDTSRFRTAPNPASISVRTGAGMDGSDRVTMTWEDGAIANQWLRIEVLASSNTGLDRPDVFVFGNELVASANPNAADIDLLYALIHTNSGQPAHDLTFPSPSVDNLDVRHLVLDIYGTHFGDTDIDGDVDFMDFLILSKHFGSSIPSWSAGDFNGDGDIGFEDFLLLASSFGSAAVDAAFV